MSNPSPPSYTNRGGAHREPFHHEGAEGAHEEGGKAIWDRIPMGQSREGAGPQQFQPAHIATNEVTQLSDAISVRLMSTVHREEKPGALIASPCTTRSSLPARHLATGATTQRATPRHHRHPIPAYSPDLDQMFDSDMTSSVPCCMDKQHTDAETDDDVINNPPNCEQEDAQTEKVVRVSFGNGPVIVRLDSGADVTVANLRIIPSDVLQQARASGEVGTGQTVKLIGPFSEVVNAELITLPCRLVNSEGAEYPMTSITIALTEHLREKVLLTPADYERLCATSELADAKESTNFDWSGIEIECIVENVGVKTVDTECGRYTWCRT